MNRFPPQAAHNVEETGLSQGLLIDLVLKHAFFEGALALAALSERTKLTPTVVHSLFRHLQKEQLCETRGMVGDDYQFALSSKGRMMAEAALNRSHYAGPAPVPLADYCRVVTAQGIHTSIAKDTLQGALADLVLSDEVIDQLGAAIMTGGAIILYGPTGTGKTSVAERLHRLFTDKVYVPHAVEVSGFILNVFDPSVHRPLKDPPLDADLRWVLCHRPMLKVGGELQAEMLEPHVDPVTRVCAGPLQMMANNGILLIDDFGRQRMTPRELLNRWIVPLDRRMDIMSLWSGLRFEIPFELLVVFATNLALSDLAEDAFMRRLKNKVKIDVMGTGLFVQLLRRVCAQTSLECTPDMEEYVSKECLKHHDGLRACFPIDLITILCGFAAFEQRPPQLNTSDVDRAIKMYFAH